MASIILIGSKENAEAFIASYIVKENIPEFGIERFSGTKIEHAREIKKKLAFKATNARLFLFTGEITTEAQNALLKCIEEHASMVHFLFSVESEDALLPTVLSRCRMVRLGGQQKKDGITIPIDGLFSNGVVMWSVLDEVTMRINEIGVDALEYAMRAYMLRNINDKRTLESLYPSCKRMFGLLHLVKNNNVSVRALVEKTFIPQQTIAKNK